MSQRQTHLRFANQTLTGIPRVVIRRGSNADVNPYCVVVLEIDRRPTVAVEVYPDPDEYLFARDAMQWRDKIVIGFGHSVAVVDPRTLESATYSTDFCSLAYFSEIHIESGHLFVITGCGLMCFDSTAQLKWQTGGLGLDGVMISDVRDGRVIGAGEWDPPGGWEHYAVDLATGSILEQEHSTNDPPSN